MLDSSFDQEILKRITEVLESFARGDFSNKYQSLCNHDKRLENVINQIAGNFRAAINHITLIAQGRYDVDFSPVSENDELGFAIDEMTVILREMSNENKKSAWIKSGQAELSNIIRGDQDSRVLSKNILSFLARYINALVGTIYLVTTGEKDRLELVGRFALEQNEEYYNMVKFGEGLVGQCAVEKEEIVLDHVPKDYLKINSSLGEVVPKYIVVIPFLIEKEIVGVMELGAIEAFNSTKMDLLRQVSENIAIALKSSRNSERLKTLLGEDKR